MALLVEFENILSFVRVRAKEGRGFAHNRASRSGHLLPGQRPLRAATMSINKANNEFGENSGDALLFTQNNTSVFIIHNA